MHMDCGDWSTVCTYCWKIACIPNCLPSTPDDNTFCKVSTDYSLYNRGPHLYIVGSVNDSSVTSDEISILQRSDINCKLPQSVNCFLSLRIGRHTYHTTSWHTLTNRIDSIVCFSESNMENHIESA